MHAWVKKLADLWQPATHVASAVVAATSKCDHDHESLGAMVVLTGDQRTEALLALQWELQARCRSHMIDAAGAMPLSTLAPLLPFLDRASQGLHRLAANGQGRAHSLLRHLALAFPNTPGCAGEGRFISPALRWLDLAMESRDPRRASFAQLQVQLDLARDVARACLTTPHGLSLDTSRPTVPAVGLFITREHESAIAASSFEHSASWHLAQITRVGRTRCTGSLLCRLNVGTVGSGSNHDEIDYPIDALATWLPEH